MLLTEFIQHVFRVPFLASKLVKLQKRDVGGLGINLIPASAFPATFTGVAGAEGLAVPHAPHTTAPSGFTSVHTGQVQGILLIYTD